MSASVFNRALPALTASLLCLALSMPLAADEVDLPEEILFDQMRAGEVEAARDGFDELVMTRIARFNSLPQDDPQAATSRVIVATEVVRAFNRWQLAEVEHRLKAGAAPDSLNDRMLIAADAIAEIGAALERDRTRMANSSADAAPAPWLQRRAEATKEKLGESMLETAAFLRGSNREEDRARLLQEAARYTTAPATLEELDDQQGDLREAFKIPAAIPQASADTGNLVVAPVSDPLRDAAVRALLENYYSGLFSGDIANLQSGFAAGYWPAQKLDYVAVKLSGCMLESLGDISTRPTGNDEYYVEIRGLTCIDALGVERKMADQLLLKREEGNFRILMIDARNR